MDKVDWYTSGFEKFGWRVRFLVWFIKLLYKLHLITEQDVKRYVDMVITAWFINQAKKSGLKVGVVNLDDEEYR